MEVPFEKWENEKPASGSYDISDFIAMTNEGGGSYFNFRDVQQEIAKNQIDKLNPYSLIDITEIRRKEVQFVVDLYVKAATGNITIPSYYRLNLDESAFVDDESRVSAAAFYITKLNYAIIGLLIGTDSSIREGIRAEWCRGLKNAVNLINMYSRVSYVTSNKKFIIKEIEAQADYLGELGENLIRLKQIRKVI
jgi:hypothetical protein